MLDNPYQSPIADAGKGDSPPGRHRSFRLTSAAAASDPAPSADAVRDAVAFSLVQQLPLLLLAALLLDGGGALRAVATASVAFWVIVVIVLVRRRTELRRADVSLLKWGFLPILVIMHLLWSRALLVLRTI